MSSRKKSLKKQAPAPVAKKDRPLAASSPDVAGREQYFPEDERSPVENEDDHSHPDIDLEAEIDKKLSGAAASPGSVPAGQDTFDDPEAERPCYEGEGDHSTADFDLDAEIEAKLGKAPDEPAERPELPPSQPVPDALPDTEDAELEHFDDPETIRPCYEDEGDHSMADFDLDKEIDAQLKKKQAEQAEAGYAGKAPPPVAGTSAEDVHDEGVHDEDERSPLEWEDDHSHVDPASHTHQAIPVPASGIHTDDKDAMPDAEKDMHPDLAASFTAFQTYQGIEKTDQDNPDAEDGSGTQDSASSGDKPDAQTDVQSSVIDPENSDGSLSESGYLDPTAAAANDLSGEEEPDALDLRDKPFPQPENEEKAPGEDTAESENADETESSDATGMAPDGSGEEKDDEDDEGEKSLREQQPGTPATGGGGDGSDEDDDEDDDSDDKPMTLRDHLRELRKRLLRAFLWMLGGFFICYPFNEQLFQVLMKPLIKVLPKTSHFIFTNPPEAFFTYLKVAFVGGIFLSSPMIFYQVWAFVAPGLYKEEKLYVIPVAIFSALFFICGGAFCYFIGLPFVFEFFMSYNTGLIQAMPSLKETLSFVLQLLLAFGLVFELPLFIFFLSRLGIVTADMMRRFRRYSVLVNVIIAAILTPPDIMSQMLMAGPLIVLYEISIFIAAIFGKKKPKPENEEDEEDEDDDGPADKDDPVPATAKNKA